MALASIFTMGPELAHQDRAAMDGDRICTLLECHISESTFPNKGLADFNNHYRDFPAGDKEYLEEVFCCLICKGGICASTALRSKLWPQHF